MTIYLSDPTTWRVAAALIGIAAAMWRFRRFLVTVETREDIIVDGWITRFSDNPTAYRAEQKRITHEHRKDVLFLVVLAAFELFVWVYL